MLYLQIHLIPDILFWDVLLLSYEYFCGYAPSILKSHNVLPRKQCHFTLTNRFIIGEDNVLPLSELIEPINTNKKCSYELNVDLGLITPWDSSLCNGFAFITKFFLIFMNMQM